MSRTIVLFNTFLLLISCSGIESAPSEKRTATHISGKQSEKNVAEYHPKQSAAGGMNKKYVGIFTAYLETEETATGTASVEYTFTIAGKSIKLETNTYHEPMQCNGKYKWVEKDSVLELYYTGKEEFCDTKSPKFFLKEDGGNLYAKGLGGEGTYNEWIKLERK